MHIHISITTGDENTNSNNSGIRRTGFSRTGFMDVRVCIVHFHSLQGVSNICLFIGLVWIDIHKPSPTKPSLSIYIYIYIYIHTYML